MRKVFVLLLALAVLVAVPQVCFAQEGLSLSDANVSAGGTVYLTVTLNEAVKGDSMGIEYFYDSAILTPVVSSCKWEVSGLISNFNYDDVGVWAAEGETELKGKICVLTLRLKTGAVFSQTEVSCKLTVNNGNATVGTYEAKATVKLDCQHAYGSWTNAGDAGHSRSCSICGANQNQSHSWDSGTKTTDETNPGLVRTLYTCTGCRATRVVESYQSQKPEQEDEIPVITGVPATEPEIADPPTQSPPGPPVQETENWDTRPQPTEVTAPRETEPSGAHDHTQTPGTQETKPYQDYNSGTQETKPYQDYNSGTGSDSQGQDTAVNGATTPQVEPADPAEDIAVPNYGLPDTTQPPAETSAAAQETEYDHHHEQETDRQDDSGVTGPIVVILGAAMAAGAYLVVKKKSRRR